MDGVSDASFRYITAKYGSPDVITTEFISVDGLAYGAKNIFNDFIYHRIERPIVAQLFGIEPEYFYQGAQIICELGFDGVDIDVYKRQDEHVATEKIAEEISDNRRTHDILKHIGASRLNAVNASTDISYKIANYADDRVSVDGIVPFEELVKERKSRNSKITDEYFAQLINKIRINEKNIQKVCKIHLHDITDDTISDIIEELNDFEIN